MKFLKIIVLFIASIILTNCTIKESITFNEDGSGSFLLNYDMAEFVNKMKEEMGDGATGGKEAIDTLMVFSDIIEIHKDSVAALPEEKQVALEAVKDMYMKMRMDEEQGVFDMGIGLNFQSIEDLKNISDKIEKAKSLNSKNDQVDAMKSSPLGKFMGEDNKGFEYSYNGLEFNRITSLPEDYNINEEKFDEDDETNKEFMEYFNNAYYIVEYTFPKKIISHSLKNAELSNNNKTISYKVSWLDFIKNPKILDINLKFSNE